MNSILLRGGRIIDPAQGIDQEGDLLLADGRVVGVADRNVSAERTIDAVGKIVCPALIDTHVSLREPGFEEDETTETGTAAALAGGFATIAAMPDTRPVVDNRHCHVLPLGAVTRDHNGQELAEIGQLVEGGAVAFTDGKIPIANAEVMRRALEYTRMFDRPILSYPMVPELAAGGVMHEGYWSTRLGLRGVPAAAQDIMVGRDIALCELTGGRVHLMCLSTEDSIDRVRRARARGIRVTCEVTPHHLALTDESLRSWNSNCKVDPPLRSQQHIDALVAGLRDGTIDAITADHQPLAEEKKDRELDLVPAGIAGLETVVPICIRALIEPGHLNWSELLARLTSGPARVLGIDKGTLRQGVVADVTMIDPQAEWTIDLKTFRSRSRNTPFAGWTVRGRVEIVIVGGHVRYDVNNRDSAGTR